MTFLEIQQAIYDVTGYDQSPPTAVTRRTKAWINEGYKRIHRAMGLNDLRPGSSELASVIDQTEYALAVAMEKIESVRNLDQQSRLNYLTRDALRMRDPGEIESGTPTHWIPMGTGPVSAQPSSTGLWVVSSAAGDTTQTATVQGITAAGVTMPVASVTLNGVTRAQLGTVTTYERVVKFVISAVGVGTISLYDAAAAGNVLATIPIGLTSSTYQIIRLWPTAVAAENYLIDGQAKVTPLTADTDVPFLPDSFHDLLVTYGEMREAKRLVNTNTFAISLQEWTDALKKMRSQVEFPSDYRPVAGAMSYDKRSGWNGLTDGGYFPADGRGE
jgi:hypothetical protein